MKLFSVRVKELFEPICLRKKEADGFLLLLKAFLWETYLWLTLGDFMLKTQICEGKFVFNWKSIEWKRFWCTAHNRNESCHICVKEFLDSNFNWAVNNNRSIYTKLLPIAHIHKNRNFQSILLKLDRPTASTLWLSRCQECIFHFCHCEPLSYFLFSPPWACWDEKILMNEQ